MTRYLVAACITIQALSAQNVLTGSYDNSRTNANLAETILSPASVQPSQFGQLFSLPADGQIYAQPLYYKGIVFIATQHNSVYAYNADVPGPPFWTVNLGPSVPSSAFDDDVDGPYTDIVPEVGILGTPVIDASTGTIYVVAETLENGTYYHRLHALDTGTGAEKFGAPAAIQATVAGTGDSSSGGVVSFVSGQHLQRPALLLLNGVVYVSFGSHGDGAPYHGWLMGYSASNVQLQTAVFNASPNGRGGAIWQSGRGPAADGKGNIYVVSSNGDTDESINYSDNVLKLTTPGLAVSEWFAPSDVQTLNDEDEDLGAAGAVLIPGTNMLVTGGKQGILYSLNSTTIKSTQNFDVADSFGIFNMALWNKTTGPLLYLHPANSPFSVYQISSGKVGTTPLSQSASGYSVPFEGMSLSANGTQAGSGILWVTTADSYPLPSTGTLHAFNADNLAQELWNGPVGQFVKFANPTVANGRVYVPGESSLLVYGLTGSQPGNSTPVITGIVNAASYAASGIAPGEIATIYGLNFGAGAKVTFNSTAAPMIYSTATALAAVVPFEVAGSPRVSVQVSYNGMLSAAQPLPSEVSAPGIFSINASGSGPGAILNQDYSVNSPTHPAAAGSVAMIYATGGGLTSPRGVTGALAAGAEPLVSPVSVTVGGVNAPVWYAGSAPGEIEGLVQINVQLPAALAGAGTVPVVVTVNGQASQSTVTLTVQ